MFKSLVYTEYTDMYIMRATTGAKILQLKTSYVVSSAQSHQRIINVA